MDANDRETRNNHYGELENSYQELGAKNAELRQQIEFLQQENALYKKKYEGIKQRLTGINECTDRNGQLFYEMYDNFKAAADMGRMPLLNSPVSKKKSLPPLKPGTSKTTTNSFSKEKQVKEVCRRQIQIQPINIQEVQEKIVADDLPELEAANEQAETTDLSLREGLSTIIEENLDNSVSEEPSHPENTKVSISNVSSIIRDVTVCVKRLPVAVMESHLKKYKSDISFNTSVSVSQDSFDVTDHPKFSSTPLKLQTLSSLGLYPTPKNINNNNVQNFVNVRKKSSKNRHTDSVSPKNAKIPMTSPKTKIRSVSTKKKKPPSSEKRLQDEDESPSDEEYIPKEEKSESKRQARSRNFVTKRMPSRTRLTPDNGKNNSLDTDEEDSLRARKRVLSEPETSPFINKRKRTSPELPVIMKTSPAKSPKSTVKYASPVESPQSKSASPVKPPPPKSRPGRKAKPKSLKEESLKDKKRRC